MEVNRGSSTAGGVSFVGLLQVAFIVLKLCGVIKWRWVWVLAPIWISCLFTAGIVIGALLIFKIKNR